MCKLVISIEHVLLYMEIMYGPAILYRVLLIIFADMSHPTFCSTLRFSRQKKSGGNIPSGYFYAT